jgi:hypothetical protein
LALLHHPVYAVEVMLPVQLHLSGAVPWHNVVELQHYRVVFTAAGTVPAKRGDSIQLSLLS